MTHDEITRLRYKAASVNQSTNTSDQAKGTARDLLALIHHIDHQNDEIDRIQFKRAALTELLREVEYYFAHGGQAEGDQVDLWARISDELGPAEESPKVMKDE
jgi:hypothetical protein